MPYQLAPRWKKVHQARSWKSFQTRSSTNCLLLECINGGKRSLTPKATQEDNRTSQNWSWPIALSGYSPKLDSAQQTEQSVYICILVSLKATMTVSTVNSAQGSENGVVIVGIAKSKKALTHLLITIASNDGARTYERCDLEDAVGDVSCRELELRPQPACRGLYFAANWYNLLWYEATPPHGLSRGCYFIESIRHES